MKPVTLKEILTLQQYDVLRPRLRPLFMVEKDRHRLAVGEHVTLLFENARTVWYQVQEMMRTERMTSEGAIRHEIDTYNELLPLPGELSATVLLEFAREERDKALRALVGIEQQVFIRIDQRREPARFDPRQMSAERVSSVQFARFPLGGLDPYEFLEMANREKVAIEITHPSLSAKGLITGTLAQALAQDLAED
ncbi:MAG: DUF3501 family protein [Candidatus Binataceae bacterium]